MCFKKIWNWLYGNGEENNDPLPELTDNSVIIIACGNYPGTANDLSGPPNDFVDFEKKIKSLFPQYIFRKFLNEQSTRQRLLIELRAVVTRMIPGDLLVFIMDTCFSETNTRGPLPDNIIQSRVFHNPKYPEHKRNVNRVLSPNSDGLHYISMSACRDREGAADAWFNGRANGAYTYALLQTIEKGITWSELDYREMEKLLELGFPQVCTIEGPSELINKKIFEGTVYCFYISSHGSHVYDVSGDEPDNQDEGPYLYDGMVLDDEISNILRNIPA